MRTARLAVFLILTSFGAAFAQSTVPQKTPQQHDQPRAAKPDSKANKDAAKAKKNDKEVAKSSSKKADNAQNQVNAQAYRTTVPKP